VRKCGCRPICKVRLKKPAAGFPARAQICCDDDDMPVICPTCQISAGRCRRRGRRSRRQPANSEYGVAGTSASIAFSSARIFGLRSQT